MLLVLVLCVLVLVVVGRQQLSRPYQFAPVVALTALPVAVYLSRHLLAASALHRLVYLVVGIVVFGALVTSALSVRNLDPSVQH